MFPIYYLRYRVSIKNVITEGITYSKLFNSTSIVLLKLRIEKQSTMVHKSLLPPHYAVLLIT